MTLYKTQRGDNQFFGNWLSGSISYQYLEQLVKVSVFTTFTVKSDTPLSASSSSYKTTCGIKQII